MHPMSRPVLLLAASLVTACGAPVESDAPSSEVADESIASQTQAVDDTCVDSGVTLAQPDGAVVVFSHPNCSYADSAATSTDGSYDQPLCPHRFVTEVQVLNNYAFQPFVQAVPSSANVDESTCKSIAIVGAAWGFRGRGWVALGSVSTAATWYPATTSGPFTFPASCGLRVNIGTGASGYTKVRVTGLAAAFGAFPFRVTTGVSGGNGPC